MHGDRQGRLRRRAFLRAAGAGVCAACAPRFATAIAGEPEHEARFYETLDGKAVRCRLCPWHCEVPPGGRGRCRVRENREGRYVSLVYGHPCTQHEDPIEKKPFFHVLPGSRAYSIATVGCNIHCKFCQNFDISQAAPEESPVPYVGPEAIARAAVARGCRTVAYTYSEPTVFAEYMIDCCKAARDVGLGNVVISNGFIGPEALAALAPLVTAYKVDLKAFTDTFYESVCDGRLQPVLDTLKRLRAAGVWTEIVVLLIPTLNDTAEEAKRLAGWVVKELGPDVPIHFTRFHAAYKLQTLPPTPPRTLAAARDAAVKEGCRFVYTGNMPGMDGESTHCPSCRTAIIKRYGLLITSNDLKAGACPKCGTAIPGVWS